MKDSELVVGEVYAYRSWGSEGAVKVAYQGRHEREVWVRRYGRSSRQAVLCHVSVDARGSEAVDQTAARYLMPWAQWEAQEADKAKRDAQERAERVEAALGRLRALDECGVMPWHGELGQEDLPDIEDAADALRTLAQCLREGGG